MLQNHNIFACLQDADVTKDKEAEKEEEKKEEASENKTEDKEEEKKDEASKETETKTEETPATNGESETIENQDAEKTAEE